MDESSTVAAAEILREDDFLKAAEFLGREANRSKFDLLSAANIVGSPMAIDCEQDRDMDWFCEVGF